MTVLTHREAAAFLKVNEATLRKLRRRGDVRGTQVGAQYRYVREHLEAYIRGPMSAPIDSAPESTPPSLVTHMGPVDPPKRAVHHRAFYAVNGGTSR